MQNKVYVIQEFIFSSSVYFLSIVLPWDIPISLEDPKFSHLSVQVDSESGNFGTKECRSRYDKFIMIEVKSRVKYKRHLCRRDREPSRIPGKRLSHLLKKSRKLRKLVRKHIKRNVPRSSRIHCFVYAFSRERKRLLNDQVRYLKCLQKASNGRRTKTASLKTSALLKNNKKRYKTIRSK